MNRRGHPPQQNSKPVPAPQAEIVDLSPREPEIVEPDIPELKKKEKERKAAGAYWHAASPGTGSTLARAPGGLGQFTLDGMANALARKLGANSILGKLLLSPAGGGIFLAGLLAAGTALGIFVGLCFKAPRKFIVAKVASITSASGPVVPASRERVGDSLGMVSGANVGAFAEAPAGADAGAAAEAAGGSEAVDGATAPSTVEAPMSSDDGGTIANPLAGAAANAKLAAAELGKPRPLLASASPLAGGGGGAGGVFGPRVAANVPVTEAKTGKPAALPRSGGRQGARSLRAAPARSGRTMGQLKFARDTSASGASQARETGAKQFGTDAFEQVRTQGGELAGGPGAGAGPQVVAPLGTGAPDVMKNAPDPGPTQNTTPYQGDLDQARKLAEQAKKMKQMGMILLGLGAALLLAGGMMMKKAMDEMPAAAAAAATDGGAMLGQVQTKIMMGALMMAAGAGMIGAGIMSLAMAQQLAKQAKAIGEMMKNRDDQKDQGQIAADDAQAKADGVEYTPPDMSHHGARNGPLHEKIEEQRTATYEINGAGQAKPANKPQPMGKGP